MLIHPRCPKESPRASSMGCRVPHPPWDSRPVPNNLLTPSVGHWEWPSHPAWDSHIVSSNLLAHLLWDAGGGRATLGLTPSPTTASPIFYAMAKVAERPWGSCAPVLFNTILLMSSHCKC